MYHRYFGLKEAPFSISVDPRYLFMGARHRDALAHLLYGVGAGGGFILLTGEVGTGKTTITRCLLGRLPKNIDIALVLNPALNASELLATVCDELGIAYDSGEQSLKILTDKLHRFLLSNHAKNRNTVLLIDEAQHLDFDVLEQIRLLTNLETNTKKLIQIILIGQPELRTLLARPELRQLAQRITARYQLKPLTLQETHAYIRYRLHIAGLPANQALFPPPVVKKLYKISRGIPRLINVLCDRSLLGTYAQNKTVVDLAIMKQASLEVLGGDEDQPPKTLSPPVLGAAGIIAIAVCILAWWQWPGAGNPAAQSVEQANQQRTRSATSSWSTNKQQALNELFMRQSLTGPIPENFCQSSTDKLIHARSARSYFLCEHQTARTWQELKDYNRPAVLTLVNQSRLLEYATLVAIDDHQAIISHHGGKLTTVSLEELGQRWTGDFAFIWQATPFFTRPVGLNHNGPIVKWLARQFAKIDNQQTLLANNTFNTALTQRVKMFQVKHNLEPDGVVGLKTLLKINDELGTSHRLSASIDANNNPPVSKPKTHTYSQLREG